MFNYCLFIIKDKDYPVDGPIFSNIEEVGLDQTCDILQKNDMISWALFNSSFDALYAHASFLKSENEDLRLIIYNTESEEVEGDLI